MLKVINYDRIMDAFEKAIKINPGLERGINAASALLQSETVKMSRDATMRVRIIPEPERTDFFIRGHWERPAGANRCSYRYKCSLCGEIAYQVTGNNGRKKKAAEPACTYKFCPHCGYPIGIPLI